MNDMIKKILVQLGFEEEENGRWIFVFDYEDGIAYEATLEERGYTSNGVIMVYELDNYGGHFDESDGLELSEFILLLFHDDPEFEAVEE